MTTSVAARFLERFQENGAVTSGFVSALTLTVNRQFCRDPDRLFNGLAIRHLPFAARHRDWLAVREVAFDQEYRIVDTILAGMPAPVVVDGGANIGLFALYVLASRPAARLWSYEPSSATYAVLAANRALNPRLDWTVCRAALWAEDGVLTFTNMESSTSSRVTPDVAQPNCVETVPARTLRNVLLDSGGTVDLMKVDIEGAEERFLCADPDLLTRIGTLLVEVHPRECDAATLIGVLARRWPYLHRVSGRSSTKPLIVASDRPLELPAFSVADA